MLASEHDRQSSIDSECQLDEAPPPPFTPTTRTAPLSWRSRVQLGRQAFTELEKAGVAIVRSTTKRARRKHQPAVKAKYENPALNYFVASVERAPCLIRGNLVEGTGFSYREIVAAEILSAAARAGSERILEVGCGDGMNVWALDHFHPGHKQQLIAFDYSYRRTLLASRYLEPTHQLFNGDAKRIALPDGSVDLAVTVHCLEHMAYDNGAAIREMARVARHVLLIEPFIEFQNMWGRVHNWRADYAKDIRSNVEQAGLAILDWRRLRLGSPFNQSGLLFARSERSDALHAQPSCSEKAR